MAHCPVEELDDLAELLDVIRTWPGVCEPRPCVFYVGRTPFLHFHINREGRRWADARTGGSWGTEIEIPRNANSDVRSRFLREVQRRYQATAKALGLP